MRRNSDDMTKYKASSTNLHTNKKDSSGFSKNSKIKNKDSKRISSKVYKLWK